ncbi:phosphoribosyl-AMP cyclohydrolase [Candidatus Carsonella ruddii]|uniref:phosphoribosyl-AMP cyclohydrolase n=1 Tax=Candidatus Carsonella ruddii HC isolate Thao2000 TaxID=1202538 RepID=J3TE93_CARRU|nr:phosphoribosyl-AMP cyclohydrolase [Candidatus Carsonella ruddii]AFP83952.1 phosphoribosyl-AMP cyclohydrolase [Candidatus Carsonella ruddii HC isolate Thao2000]
MNKLIYKILFLIKWKKKIFPVIIQDYNKNKILMLSWINKWNLIESFFFKKTCYWSRSRNKNWRKGEISINIQIIKKIFFDCDIDSYLFYIKYKLNNCHYNLISCYNYNL